MVCDNSIAYFTFAFRIMTQAIALLIMPSIILCTFSFGGEAADAPMGCESMGMPALDEETRLDNKGSAMLQIIGHGQRTLAQERLGAEAAANFSELHDAEVIKQAPPADANTMHSAWVKSATNRVSPIARFIDLPAAITQAGFITLYYSVELANNGKLYAVPDQAQSVLEIDPETRTTRAFPTALSSLDEYTKVQKFQKVVAADNGKLYGLPHGIGKVLEISPNDGYARTLADQDYTADRGDPQYPALYKCGVLAGNGKIYAPPGGASKVLEIDPATSTSRQLADFTYTRPNFQSVAYATAVLAKNGKIYAPPFSATHVLEIDPTTATSRFLDAEIDNSGALKYMDAVLARNGKIYCPPYQKGNSWAPMVLEIDPKTGTSRYLPDEVSGSPRFSSIGAVAAGNGKIYASQYDSSVGVLEIDPATGTHRHLGGDCVAAVEMPVLAANGLIYMFGTARIGSIEKPLELDPATGTCSRLDWDEAAVDQAAGTALGFGLWHSAVLAGNGNIYAIPWYQATKVLEITAR